MDEVPVFVDGCGMTVVDIQSFLVREVVLWKVLGEFSRNSQALLL